MLKLELLIAILNLLSALVDLAKNWFPGVN